MRDVTAETARLQTEEAIDLAHAWVHILASSLGVRALFVKGPALYRRGLRKKRTSSDVDVLVAPEDFGRLCSALEEAGWGERDSGFVMRNVSHHSRAFVSPSWPCDIDVHTYFPGFLADPTLVFDTLWARRSSLRFAGQRCAVTDRVSSALVLALHSLRSTKKDARHSSELTQLYSASFTPAEQKELGLIAAHTGSAEALEGVLSHLGVAARLSDSPIDPSTLRAWRVRTEVSTGGLGAYVWLRAFRAAPLRMKPKVLMNALWPSDHDFLVMRPDLPHDPKVMNAARRRRLVRGVATLPGVVAAIWRNKPTDARD